MRVPDSGIYSSSTLAINRTRMKMNEAVKQSATGRRVERPWDDPAAAGRSALLQASESRLRSIGNGAERARDELQAADNALSTISDDLAQARQLAVQMASDSYSPEDRTRAAAEVAQIREALVGSLNREVAGRYIFAGDLDNVPPFDAVGTYLGDTGAKTVEIAPGVFESASVRADQAIKGSAGGVDIFAELADLETALLANDAVAITDAIEGLDFSYRQVVDSRSEAGTRAVLFDAAGEANRIMAEDDQIASARLTDADIIESAQNLSMAQTALNAALSASAKSFQLTLLDKLR